MIPKDRRYYTEVLPVELRGELQRYKLFELEEKVSILVERSYYNRWNARRLLRRRFSSYKELYHQKQP